MLDSGQSKRFTEWSKFLPVGFVVLVITILYGIYVGYHCWPLLQIGVDPLAKDHDRATRGLVEIIVFHILTLMLLYCYLQSILVNPGNIPETPEWMYPTHRTSDPSPAMNLQETKRSGDRRHCKWCGKFKPDRCHHCRVCRVCVLKMDHHCPWIYNCVGFGNHKYFFLLLFYSALCCHWIIWTMLESVKAAIHNDESFAEMFLLLFGESLGFFLGMLITAFFFFHIWLMMKSMTTIEFCEKQLRQSSDGGYSPSVYSRGIEGNLKAVLGPNPFLWLLPVGLPQGDGLTFVSESTLLTVDLESGKRIRSTSHRRVQRQTRPRRSQGGQNWDYDHDGPMMDSGDNLDSGREQAERPQGGQGGNDGSAATAALGDQFGYPPQYRDPRQG